MAIISVPARVRDITAEWMTEALRDSAVLTHDSSVTSVAMSRLGVGTGFAGRCVLLNLNYERPGAGPPSIVLKVPAAYEPTRRRMTEQGCYAAEVGYFRDLAARTPVAAPVCYWAGIDDESGNFVLLLEYVSAGRMESHTSGCSLEDATLALKTLARIHARWWGAAELARSEWLRAHAAVMEGLLWGDLDAAWPLFRERYAGILSDEDLDGLDLVRTQTAFLKEWSRIPPLTLVHGDFRLENLLFLGGKPADSVAVLDWQLAGLGAGAYDLAYMMSWNLPPDRRAAWEQSSCACTTENFWRRVSENTRSPVVGTTTGWESSA